jgi:hypothetical protein
MQFQRLKFIAIGRGTPPIARIRGRTIIMIYIVAPLFAIRTECGTMAVVRRACNSKL